MNIKRKRGGQPGNQNARKHGLYSSSLSVDQICELANILNAGGQEPVLIALRIKLVSALKSAPDNRRVLMEASKILYKWYLSQDHPGKENEAIFKAFVRAILKAIRKNQPLLTERIVSESPKTPENLTERIEANKFETNTLLAVK